MATKPRKNKWEFLKHPLFVGVVVVAVGGMVTFLAKNLSSSPASNNSGVQIKDNGTIRGPVFNTVGNSNILIYIEGRSESATKEDITAVREQLRDLQKSLKSDNSTNFSEVLEGYSLQVLVSIHPTDKQVRKYIVDTGTCALFLDANNSLRFAVKDYAGEEHSVKLDSGPGTFLFDHFIFLSCDAGYSDKHSILRIRVNGTILARSEDNYDLQLVGPFQGKEGPTVGSRKDGSNPGSFTMLFLSIAKILNDQQNFDFMKIILQFEKELGRPVDLSTPSLSK